MKKVKGIVKFVSNSINALIGSLSAIGFIEVVNLIISICLGEYVRIDGGSLQKVLEMYMFLGLYGYGYAWIIIFAKKISENKEKDIMQKTKEIIIIIWGILFILNIISGIILSDLLEALRFNLMYSVMFGGALLFLYLYDKIIINKINNKIKENVKKED